MSLIKPAFYLLGFLIFTSHAIERHSKTFEFERGGGQYWKLSNDSAQQYIPTHPASFNDYFDILVEIGGTQSACPGTTLYSLNTQGNRLYTIQQETPIDYTVSWDLGNTTLYTARPSIGVGYYDKDSLFLYQDKQDAFHLCQLAKSRRQSPCANVPVDPPLYTGLNSLTLACESAIDGGALFQSPAPLALREPTGQGIQSLVPQPGGALNLPAGDQVISVIGPSGAAVPYRLQKQGNGSVSVLPLSKNRIVWIVASRQGQARLYRFTP